MIEVIKIAHSRFGADMTNTPSTDDIADAIAPQLYLISPPQIELSTFPALLGQMLDEVDVACFRLALASSDDDAIARAADACREVCHARDVAIVIEHHLLMVDKLGLDGVHLTDGARTIRHARKELGDDAIVGSNCAASRHDGLNAAEGGADYVCFGPCRDTGLGDGTLAEPDLFQWWSEMIEVPCVAEGGLDAATIRALAPISDFFAVGAEVWNAENPTEALKTLHGAMI